MRNKRRRKPPTREQLDAKNKKARESRANMTIDEKESLRKKRREYYANLPKERKEKYSEADKKRYEKIKEDKERYEKEQKRKADYSLVYRKNNAEKLKKYTNNWCKRKFASDEIYRFKTKMRSMLKDAMRRAGCSKMSRTVEILGCSFDELKKYLENQFEPWMNWDNYGKYNGEFNYGWDIDHIIPLSKGTTIDEIHKLNHYLNLRPLCSKINRDIKRNTFQ